MENTHGVEFVQIQDGIDVYRASYYVADGTIHVNLGGRSMVTPMGNVPASATVRALLLGHALKAQRTRFWSEDLPAALVA